MRTGAGALVLCVAWLAPCADGHAQAISSQPLPAPGAPPVVLPRPAAPAPEKKPAETKPTAKRPQATKPAVPVVPAPAGAPRKAPAHPAHAPPGGIAKPAGKPAPAAKPGPPPPATPAPTATPAPAAPKADPTKGTSTGLPIPRWVSFRADEVNLRSGPGMQYPIDWVYHRRDYPVQVLREYEVWRLVQDQDGTKGWVHQATLTGRRGFAIDHKEQVLRAGAADTADPVAELMPGVVGHIRKCAAGSPWCEVQTGSYRGWLRRDAIYGVTADEAIE